MKSGVLSYVNGNVYIKLTVLKSDVSFKDIKCCHNVFVIFALAALKSQFLNSQSSPKAVKKKLISDTEISGIHVAAVFQVKLDATKWDIFSVDILL